jgi:hypothetical protein
LKEVVMKKIVLMLITAGILGAQTLEDDVRNMAVSLTDNAAALISSGVISNAGCRGGLPHFNVGVAANASWFKFTNPVTSGEISFPAIFPYLYGEVGIFKGFSFTPLLRGIFAVDILGKYAPTLIKSDYFEESPYLMGYGIKVQILKDQLVPPTPAISVAIMNHEYKNLTFKFDTLYTNLKLRDLSIRASISKNVLLLTPYVGVSYDIYSLNTNYWTTGDTTRKEISAIENNSFSYFGGVEFKILLIKGYLEGLYRNKRFGLTLGIKAGI